METGVGQFQSLVLHLEVRFAISLSRTVVLSLENGLRCDISRRKYIVFCAFTVRDLQVSSCECNWQILIQEHSNGSATIQGNSVGGVMGDNNVHTMIS